MCSDFLTVAAKSTHELNILSDDSPCYNDSMLPQLVGGRRWSVLSQHVNVWRARAHLLIKYWHCWLWAALVVNWEIIWWSFKLKTWSQSIQSYYYPFFTTNYRTVHFWCLPGWVCLSPICLIQCLKDGTGCLLWKASLGKQLYVLLSDGDINLMQNGRTTHFCLPSCTFSSKNWGFEIF